MRRKKRRKKQKEKEKKEGEEKATRKNAEQQKAQVVPRERKVVEQAGETAAMPAHGVEQSTIMVETLIKAVTSSIEATTPLVSINFTIILFSLSLMYLLINLQFLFQAQTMLEGLGDINKLLEDVFLTLQQCQTPTKASSILTPLEPTKDQL
jgi:hypothetical protein